ncbi:MAG: flagellar hook-associated protein FlgL [Pseudomonadota bacterium]
MVDRLSTLQTFQLGLASILEREAELQRTQQELATGQKLLSPADDPSAAVQVLDIEEDLALVEQYGRNATLARSQLSLEESALSQLNIVLQRVRELAIQSNSAAQTPETRNTIAVELNERLNEMLAIANSKDGNDEFLFSGFQSRTQPFTRQGNTVSYQGDDGQRFLEIAQGSQVAVRDSGSRVFLQPRAGNGSFDFSADAANTGTAVVTGSSADSSFQRDDYRIQFIQALPTDPLTYEVYDGTATLVASGTYISGNGISFNGATVIVEGEPQHDDVIEVDSDPRQSMFVTVAELIDVLEASDDSATSDAAVANAVSSALSNLNRAVDNLLEVQTDVGVRLGRIDTQEQINADFDLSMRQALSDVQDLDFAEAISRLNLQLVALQAAQQTFVTTQRLSLFDYI